MAEARIYYSGKLDHNVRLADGPTVFGSSFDSDIVLFDDAVQPSHFTVMLDEAGAVVTLSEGAALTLGDADGAENAIEGGQSVVITTSQVLVIGQTEIRFRDLPEIEIGTAAVAQTPTGTRRVFALARSSTIFLLVGVLATGLYFGTPVGGVSVGNAGVFATPLSDMPRRAPGDTLTARPMTTATTLATSLTAAGYRPDALRQTDHGFEAEFYVALPRDQQALRAHLANLSEPVVARIFVDDAIRRAAELGVSMTKAEAPEIVVNAGQIVLRGTPADATWRKTVADMLKRDIPGVKSVDFEGRSEAWKDLIDDNLAAVWSGQNPYLVLTDGRKIRQGQNIDEDTVFRGIRDMDVLLVTVNETHEEYELQ
jgi:hypothetical protein